MARRALVSVFVALLLLSVSLLQPVAALSPAKSDDAFLKKIASDLDRLPTVRSNVIPKESQNAEPVPWYETTTMDTDRDKVFDNLEAWLETGNWAAVFVDLDHTPTQSDVAMIERLDVTVAGTYKIVDAIGVYSATPEQVRLMTTLPGVVMVEPSGRPVMYMDVAIPNAKARDSAEYSPYSAWDSGYSGEGVVIAVMDTGIDNAHPALTGKWLGGADISKPETPWWPRDGTFDADDTNGHGSTCAGIATSTGAPDGKYMGSAPDARLVDLRIGTKLGYAPGEGPQNYYDATLQALDWAIQFAEEEWSGGGEYKGIDVLSLSWGNNVGGSSDGQDVYSRAINELAESTDVIPIIAAGNAGPSNDGFDGLGAADSSISIAATDDLNTIDRSDDVIAEYSSRGPRKDDGDDNPYEELKPNLAAPGTNIMGVQYDSFGDGSGNGYGSRGSGTSYATPVISGVVALLLEANGNLTNELVRDVLQHTAERRGPPTVPELDPFWNRDFGYGIVDAYNATRMAANITDVSVIDTNLQAFVMNVTEGGDSFMVEGISYAKMGYVESVEVSVDGGAWKQAKDQSNETWAKWTFSISKGGLAKGNHTVKARAISGDKQSLEDEATFYSSGSTSSVLGQVDGNMLAAVAFIVTGVVIVLLLYKYGKLQRYFNMIFKRPSTAPK